MHVYDCHLFIIPCAQLVGLESSAEADKEDGEEERTKKRRRRKRKKSQSSQGLGEKQEPSHSKELRSEELGVTVQADRGGDGAEGKGTHRATASKSHHDRKDKPKENGSSEGKNARNNADKSSSESGNRSKRRDKEKATDKASERERRLDLYN